jgi:hypothetical protein
MGRVGQPRASAGTCRSSRILCEVTGITGADRMASTRARLSATRTITAARSRSVLIADHGAASAR